MLKRSFLLAALCLCGAKPLGAQQDSPANGEPLSLEERFNQAEARRRQGQSAASGQIMIKDAPELFASRMGDLKQQSTVFDQGVTISMQEGDVAHEITAKRIEINQTEKMLSAQGSVIYKMTNSSGTQSFLADRLYFRSDNWQGILVNVTGEAPSGDIIFYISGTEIRKGEDNLVIVDDAVVTSCDAAAPHYAIKAKKLWNLDQGEWVMAHSLFYLGRVPLLYLPIYYHSQNIFFLNPVFGYRTREGFYINTTTYLLGDKENSDTLDFSLMSDTGEDRSSLIRESTANHLKIMADYYGRLGGFVGLGAGIEALNFSAIAGFGFSRTIFSSGMVYSSTHMQSNEWNGSYFQSKRLPFRFGIDLSGERAGFSFGSLHYSDPYFAEDFFRRHENPSFLGFIGPFASGSLSDDTITTLKTYASYKNNFQPGLSGLGYVNIDYFDLEMNSNAFYNRDPNVSSSSPETKFFGPTLFNLPNTQFELGADFILYDGKAAQSTGANAENADDSPVIYTEAAASPDSYAPQPFERAFQEGFWSHKLFYSLKGNGRIFYEPNSSNWRQPQNVRLLFNNWRSSLSGKVSFGAESSRSDGFFLVNQSMYFEGSKQDHFNIGADKDPAGAALSDEKGSAFFLGNRFLADFRPFVDNERLQESRFYYLADVRFYEDAYNATSSSRETRIRANMQRHQGIANLRYDTGFYWFFSENEATLPNLSLSGQSLSGAGIVFFDFSNEAGVYARKISTERESVGFALESAYEPTEWFSLSNIVEVDFERGLHKAAPRIDFFGFYTTFVWEERDLVEWNATNFVWDNVLNANGSQKNKFIPSYLEIGLSQKIPIGVFWRNRIAADLLLSGEWHLDWLEYNNSSLTFGLGINFTIYKALSFFVKTSSSNNATHIYIPFMRDALGITAGRSFFMDLLQSFNFFDKSKRSESLFKLDTVELGLALDMHDWTVDIGYSGRPAYATNGITKEWQNKFTLEVKWTPLPAISSTLEIEDDVFTTS